MDRFCQRVLDDVQCIALDSSRTSHERYLALFKLLDDRNETMSAAFDNPRRSAALLQLAQMCAQRLLIETDVARFSDETRQALRKLEDVGR